MQLKHLIFSVALVASVFPAILFSIKFLCRLHELRLERKRGSKGTISLQQPNGSYAVVVQRLLPDGCCFCSAMNVWISHSHGPIATMTITLRTFRLTGTAE